jgi:hypothetical protein
MICGLRGAPKAGGDARHPAVQDCAAIAVADPIVDEEIKLVIVER